MQILKKIIFLLTPNERRVAGLLLFMIMLMAMLDVIGVASIMPFIAVLTNPGLIETNFILNYFFRASNVIGVETIQQFLFVLGISVFLLLILSLAFKAITMYALLRFTRMREYSIGKRLVEGYLYQPYSWFLNHHSADIGTTILSEVQIVINNGIQPMMNLIAQSIVAITLLTLLIIINVKLALITGIILILSYGLIYNFLRGFLKQIGQEHAEANHLRFTAMSEAFGAVKEVKVSGLEKLYIKKFSDPAQIFAKHQATQNILSQLPRFALEAVAFGGMLIVTLYLMRQSGTFVNALPIIALYAFAGYRLMPALQQIYASITQLRFIGPTLDTLHEDLKNISTHSQKNNETDILHFKNKITLNNICYNYPNSSRTALNNINLNIPIGSKVGIIGSTGSGKTSTVDIILALLKAQKGTLEVDGKIINETNRRAWQRLIGYVPQHIYLSDDTVSANIAFGSNIADINHSDVESCAKTANLHEFIVNELPDKYKTSVGERGVRLSGGQRQRIGIARALYYKPKVLILDEATSALDNKTEQLVMDSIQKLYKDITVITIAHRLNTVKNSDIVFLIENGQIVGQGPFDKLSKENELLKSMILSKSH